MYYQGNICVLTSSDEGLGILFELKGKGCRQFECCLKGQEMKTLQIVEKGKGNDFFGDRWSTPNATTSTDSSFGIWAHGRKISLLIGMSIYPGKKPIHKVISHRVYGLIWIAC